MCYAAYKLWNVCNYERRNYRELGLSRYPDWYYQKAAHKEDVWFKSLPSQTAQEVCKLLDKSWKSFYQLQKSGGVENPRPPRFKQDKMPVTYMQNGLKHEEGSRKIRLTLSKRLKEYMSLAYDIHADYLILENRIFEDMDRIKQIRLYPPKGNESCEMIVIYEVPDPELKPENEHCLSIDLGLHNLMTCYDSHGESFLLGRKYLAISQWHDKEIARIQRQWWKCQTARGVRYPKPSKRVLALYEKKRNSIKDYLHKITKALVEYCEEKDIRTVIIGDVKNIRKNKNLGKKTNQKLHSLPFAMIYQMLEYKLHLRGIRFVKQEESYSSQCGPMAKEVSKEYASKANRRHRGLYFEGTQIYNADALGAYNIMRKYYAVSGKKRHVPVTGLAKCATLKVAV